MRRAGFTFDVVQPGTDEEFHTWLSPAELVLRHARSKSQAVAETHRDAVVVGSDTLVVLDGKPLGKPADRREAEAMLGSLNGREHHVCTGVSVVCAQARFSYGFVDRTWVWFRKLDAAGIADYLDSINPLDKAGAYAIQGNGGRIIESVAGNLDTVMGLPMRRLEPVLHHILGAL